MKRSLEIVAALLLLLLIPVTGSAGVFDAEKVFQVGARGGANFTTTGSVSSDVKHLDFSRYTGFHIGASFRFNLPAGFSLQPEVLYRQSGSKVTGGDFGKEFKIEEGAFFIPLELQWGPRFSIVRPYVSGHIGGNFPVMAKLDGNSVMSSMYKASFCYGLGVGLEIWKFSLAWRYNWTTAQFREGTLAYPMLKDATLNGFDISLAFLF